MPVFAYSQQNKQLDITAKYISLYLKDTTGKSLWRPIREMPAGDFKCLERENGDLLITYNRIDPPSKLINTTKDYQDLAENYPKELCGFIIKGFYHDPEQPIDLFLVLYYDKNRPNTLIMIKCLGDGKQIFGVNFYSDQMFNPLQAENIQFKLL